MMYYKDNSNKVSAIILSGGLSSRMGEDKCDLVFNGDTLLNAQIDKMRRLGITDIVAAGYRGKDCDVKVVHDNMMKGPLSGMYLGLKEILNDRALVLSVDVPLLREESLKKIIDYSLERDLDIVTIGHDGKREQLIGVFKKSLIDKLEDILAGDNYSVMKLIDRSKEETLFVNDDETYFLNVNNKDDYKKLLEMKFLGGKL